MSHKFDASRSVRFVEILYHEKKGRVYGIRFLDANGGELVAVGEITSQDWRNFAQNQLYTFELDGDERLIGTISSGGDEQVAVHYGLRFIIGREKGKFLLLKWG